MFYHRLKVFYYILKELLNILTLKLNPSRFLRKKIYHF